MVDGSGVEDSRKNGAVLDVNVDGKTDEADSGEEQGVAQRRRR